MLHHGTTPAKSVAFDLSCRVSITLRSHWCNCQTWTWKNISLYLTTFIFFQQDRSFVNTDPHVFWYLFPATSHLGITSLGLRFQTFVYDNDGKRNHIHTTLLCNKSNALSKYRGQKRIVTLRNYSITKYELENCKQRTPCGNETMKLSAFFAWQKGMWLDFNVQCQSIRSWRQFRKRRKGTLQRSTAQFFLLQNIQINYNQ